MALNLNKGAKLGKYFYIVNNVEYGPVDIDELLKYINKDTLIYYEGIRWTKASEIPEIKKFFITEKKVVEKVVVQKAVEKNNTNGNSYLLVFLLFIALSLVIYFYVEYENRLSKDKYDKEQAFLLEMRKIEENNLLEARQDSINKLINTKLDSMVLIEKKVIFLQNKSALVDRIKKYYDDKINNKLDAMNYFSEVVNRYDSLFYVTPDEINSNIKYNRYFNYGNFKLQDETFEFKDYIDGVFYFSYYYEVDIYAFNETTTHKYYVEIGFEENYKIISYIEFEV